MRYIFLLFLLFFISCQPSKQSFTAQQLIDKTIITSGASSLNNAKLSFRFREKSYKAYRNYGVFKLSRIFKKDSNIVKDVLSNDGFIRTINNKKVVVSKKEASRFSNALNSVHYFAALPYGLNDAAVRKKMLGSATIKGKEYYKVEITFTENGGGEDFEDVFIYWIGKQDFLIDYLAYSFHTNGGGKRFRVLKEQCVRNGVRFVDYHNYKPLDSNTALINLDTSFENNELTKVSEIVLENIQVVLNNN
ncbi:DUF6503 family protein [Polaribacter tangerinus]|uniref:DUF6503 family protein n=1 Tax=Polaribacter tangerinus TaxID=1920034 RepID=UPI000B4BCA37|nr:DUF6503 family protein [Polaribacter tangerinus]